MEIKLIKLIVLITMSTLTTYANFAVCLICLPRKRSLAFAFLSATFVYIAVVIIILTTPYLNNFRFVRGLLIVPLYLFILKGSLFEKLFVVSLQITFTSILHLFIEGLAGFFMPLGELWYYLAMLCMGLVIFPAYVLLAWRFGRQTFRKLYTYGRTKEWVLYSLGVLFSLLCFNDCQRFSAL